MRPFEREKIFMRIHQSRCKCQLAYEPATFKVTVNKIEFKYTPDFYCRKTLSFYEVVGSRQAFHSDKFKIEAFQRAYPQIKFYIVDPDGKGHLHQGLSYRNGNSVPVAAIPELYDLRKECIFRLREYALNSGITAAQISREIGMSGISQIMNGTTKRIHPLKCAKVVEYLKTKGVILERAIQ
jgi:hypothetical protein